MCYITQGMVEGGGGEAQISVTNVHDPALLALRGGYNLQKKALHNT